MDVESDDMPGTVPREIPDRESIQPAARFHDQTLRRRKREKTSQLTARVGNAFFETKPIEAVEPFEIGWKDLADFNWAGARVGCGVVSHSRCPNLPGHGTRQPAHRLPLIARSASRFNSRSRMASRLSCNFLPFTNA